MSCDIAEQASVCPACSKEDFETLSPISIGGAGSAYSLLDRIDVYLHVL